MMIDWPKTPSPRQLRAIRAWFGIKQPDFARRCSISHSALADYELARRNTSNEVMVAIGLYVQTLKVKFNGNAIALEE